MYLNKDNFELFAAKCYDNPTLYTHEFEEDLKRFSYIKRLFNQYVYKDTLKVNHIINHIIVLHNVFGDKSVDMMFYKMPEHSILIKTFLLYLHRLPKSVKYVDPPIDDTTLIPIDIHVWQELKKI
jgi:hypothetical protein